jgi:hypothetical protein
MADGIEADLPIKGKSKRIYKNGRTRKQHEGPRFWVRDSPARAEAKRLGQITFMPEQACKKGHTGPRNVKSGNCVACTTAVVMAWGKTEAGKASKKKSESKESLKEKIRLKSKRHRLKRRDYHRKYNRIKSGLPAPSRPEPDFCECCGRPRSPHKTLSLDHCHTAGNFRGWVCNSCNCAIGLLGDTLAGVQKAVAYLQAYENTLVAQNCVI